MAVDMTNTLELILKRLVYAPTFTTGTLKTFANNETKSIKLYDTLEPSESSKMLIPNGSYKVIISYSPRFKRELPLLLNVPGFEGIRIHRGNTSKDTQGCILPGKLVAKGVLELSGKSESELIDCIKYWKATFISIS